MNAISRPRGPYRNGIRRKQQIIDAAWAIFARRGYAGASLRQIAEAVEVSPAALLRYFGSKEELLIAVLDNWELETSKLIPGAPVGLDYFAFYPELMRYHMSHQGLIELFLTLCAEASDPAHPARAWVAGRYERIVDEAVDHLRRARAAGEILPLSDEELVLEIRGLFALMDGLELQWLAQPSLDLAATFEPLFHATIARWTGRPPLRAP